MKTICLYFEIHQIIHLKRYRFFDIGTDHYYYDGSSRWLSLFLVQVLSSWRCTLPRYWRNCRR